MAAPADKQVLKLNTAAGITWSDAVTANTAFKMDAGHGDYKTMLLFNAIGASGDASVTIAKGDGPMAAQKDLTFTVTDETIAAIVIDSAYFKQYKLENFVDGYKVTSTVAIKAAVVELPQ
jgi:hypothetical protein